jgi:uncharacterized protein
MKRLLLIVLPLLLIVGCSKKPIDAGVLIDIDGVKYEHIDKGPYNGKVISEDGYGNTKMEGSYKDGKRDSLWTIWYENGNKKMEGSYMVGNKDGLWTTWYESGLDTLYRAQETLDGGIEESEFVVGKRSESIYRDGELNGLYTFWYENGKKKLETKYQDGIEEGISTFWDLNPSQTSYNGRLNYQGEDGEFLTFHNVEDKYFPASKKQIKSHITYKNGDKVGLWTEWDENGQKKSEINYKYNEYSGKWTEWYDNGNKKVECHYKNGNDSEDYGYKLDGGVRINRGNLGVPPHGLNGKYTYWYENGNKKSEGFWKVPKSRSYEKQYQVGKWTEWFENGQKKSEGEYKIGRSHEGILNQYKVGQWTEWRYDDGRKRLEESYMYGYPYWKHGLWTEYYDNGRKKIEKNWKNGGEHGLSTEYYDNGQKKIEENWKNGSRISAINYHRDGSVK